MRCVHGVLMSAESVDIAMLVGDALSTLATSRFLRPIQSGKTVMATPLTFRRIGLLRDGEHVLAAIPPILAVATPRKGAI